MLLQLSDASEPFVYVLTQPATNTPTAADAMSVAEGRRVALHGDEVSKASAQVLAEEDSGVQVMQASLVGVHRLKLRGKPVVLERTRRLLPLRLVTADGLGRQ